MTGEIGLKHSELFVRYTGCRPLNMGSAHTEFHCHGLTTRVDFLSPLTMLTVMRTYFIYGRSQFMVFTGSLTDTVTKYS